MCRVDLKTGVCTVYLNQSLCFSYFWCINIKLFQQNWACQNSQSKFRYSAITPSMVWPNWQLPGAECTEAAQPAVLVPPPRYPETRGRCPETMRSPLSLHLSQAEACWVVAVAGFHHEDQRPFALQFTHRYNNRTQWSIKLIYKRKLWLGKNIKIWIINSNRCWLLNN